MSTPMIFVDSLLAQTPAKKTQLPAKKTQTAQQAAAAANPQPPSIWMFTTGGLALLLIAGGVFVKIKSNEIAKRAKLQDFKIKDLQKKLKLALDSIHRMESNPDLVNSREFNLDYLRMRMDEEVFHFAVVNQIKVRVKELITLALRPTQASQAAVGIASTQARQVDEIFDVIYETGEGTRRSKRVLFRIQIKLMKLPTQATSATISQIIDCIETFLSPADDHDTWQPTIQGRIVKLNWDQKAKPTPLLVLEQLSDGVNVSFRTKRAAGT
ncbi:MULTISPECIES: hypothetical protein [Cyanophyceae]|uniref:hypothetical protein n=1 Tax=Cyanophyceae TaxID=3028117 RepID=UPI001689AA43|nr:hypothetical protein [Trichocoleus sp. FACHB-69]MBD1931738.1 hypothetical protein [Trichocoleus sp. FACHB-69]